MAIRAASAETVFAAASKAPTRVLPSGASNASLCPTARLLMAEELSSFPVCRSRITFAECCDDLADGRTDQSVLFHPGTLHRNRLDMQHRQEGWLPCRCLRPARLRAG